MIKSQKNHKKSPFKNEKGGRKIHKFPSRMEKHYSEKNDQKKGYLKRRAEKGRDEKVLFKIRASRTKKTPNGESPLFENKKLRTLHFI